jgi:hypothetical protein
MPFSATGGGASGVAMGKGRGVMVRKDSGRGVMVGIHGVETDGTTDTEAGESIGKDSGVMLISPDAETDGATDTEAGDEVDTDIGGEAVAR